MVYWLGVDLGTTYTAAAVRRDGQTTMATLGTRIPEIPTVVAYDEHGDVLIGEPADRRAATEPDRVAREFKRRIGDPVPLIVAGGPRSAESLMALVLRHVIAEVTAAEGSEPDQIIVTHPASWGPYKTAQLEQIFQLAGCPSALTVTEPEAAARHYAALDRIQTGNTIAVFDFGGGTFDAAVLHSDASGSYQLLGEASGLERLGGVDLDHAVFQRVVDLIDLELSELEDTPANRHAIARLRSDCVVAKEALSSDTSTTVPVLLPELHSEVRLTRREFEEMIRPVVVDSIAAIDSTIAGAGLATEDVTAILLVGGSSRIPLVSQLVTEHLNRPTLIDAHPKHSIASGAALLPSPAVVGPPTSRPVRSDTPTETTLGPDATATDRPEVAGPSAPAPTPTRPPPEQPVAPESATPTGDGSPAPVRRLVFGASVFAVLAVLVAGLAFLFPSGDDAESPADAAAALTTVRSTTTASPTSSSLVESTTSSTVIVPSLADLIGDEIAWTAYNVGFQVTSLPDRGPEQPPELAWQVASDLFTGPVGLDDVVYVSLPDPSGIPYLAAYDADTGAQLWVNDEPQLTTILVTNEVIVVHWLGGFRFHDPATGEVIDEIGMPSSLGPGQLYVNAADLRDGRIYAAGGYGEGADATAFVVALDLETGEPVWTYEDQSLGWDPLDSAPSFGTDGSTVVYGDLSAVVALDAGTGEELWRTLDLTGRDGLHFDGGVLVTSPEPTVNRGLDARTGELLWEFTENTSSKYASDGTNFYVVADGIQLQARRLETGDLVWTADGPVASGASWPTVAIGGDLVYLVNESGPAAAFRLSSGDLVWSSSLEGLSPAFGLFPVATADGRLLILQDETVKVYR